jgi:hypothetical protein
MLPGVASVRRGGNGAKGSAPFPDPHFHPPSVPRKGTVATAVSAFGTWTCATEPVRCLTSKDAFCRQRNIMAANFRGAAKCLRTFSVAKATPTLHIMGSQAVATRT